MLLLLKEISGDVKTRRRGAAVAISQTCMNALIVSVGNYDAILMEASLISWLDFSFCFRCSIKSSWINCNNYNLMKELQTGRTSEISFHSPWANLPLKHLLRDSLKCIKMFFFFFFTNEPDGNQTDGFDYRLKSVNKKICF